MNQETKVGFFLLAAISAILASILMLGNIKLFSRQTKYFIEFADVEALPPKAGVKIAGVEIGKVQKVSLVNGRALVTIRIAPDISLHDDATGRIGSTGVIGTRFVELFPGSVSRPVLPPESILRGENASSLNQMIAKISALFEEDEKHGNAVDNLKATLAHIRNVASSLDSSVGQRSEDLNDIVSNIKDLTESAKVFTAHLEEISTERKEDVKLALQKFKDVSVKLDTILAKIQSGEGTIGTLVNDEQTATDVKEAVSSIKETAQSAKKVLGRFTMVHTYWNYRLRYDTRDDEARSDVGITFVPVPGKYYSLAVTNVGEVPSNEKNTEVERKNRFTATLGADWGPFTGYAGAIRSRGGIGLNIKPFYKKPKWGKRLELNAEAADFNRDRVVNGETLQGTWLAAGAHVALRRWWWVGVRGEDLLDRAAFHIYTNITFRDEDFAYLMGLASIAR